MQSEEQRARQAADAWLAEWDAFSPTHCRDDLAGAMLRFAREASTPAQDVALREAELAAWEKQLSDRADWHHPDTAPKDGTILELAVDYTDGHSPLQDAIRACTIGWNSLDDTGEDEWQIVGWDWCQDHIRSGAGKIVAWRPSRLMACDDALPPLPPTFSTPAHTAQADPVIPEEKRLSDVIREAKRVLTLMQGCLECSAEDERRWSDTITWLEGLA